MRFFRQEPFLLLQLLLACLSHWLRSPCGLEYFPLETTSRSLNGLHWVPETLELPSQWEHGSKHVSAWTILSLCILTTQVSVPLQPALSSPQAALVHRVDHRNVYSCGSEQCPRKLTWQQMLSIFFSHGPCTTSQALWVCWRKERAKGGRTWT